MVYSVTNESGTFEVNLDNEETQTKVLTHELGHAIVAINLGYPSSIYYDLEKHIFSTQNNIINGSIENCNDINKLEDNATVLLGGWAAENWTGKVTMGSIMGDFKALFNTKKRIAEIKGKNFPYKVILDREFASEYKENQDEAWRILSAVDKNSLINAADQYLKLYKQGVNPITIGFQYKE